MGTKTKIDWCDSTWNPVTGCLHGCEYCYARNIAERFGSHMQPLFAKYPILQEPVRCSETYEYMREIGRSEGTIQPYPFDFMPTFHHYKLDEPQHWREPRNIFVCSMADLFGDWVPDEWKAEVLMACARAPQHRYLFLTKNPTGYVIWLDREKYPSFSEYTSYTDNMWFGVTYTGMERLQGTKFDPQDCKSRMDIGTNFWYLNRMSRNISPYLKHKFLSIEPISCDITEIDDERFRGKKLLRHFLHGEDYPCRINGEFEWVIVGAETGNRKDKVVPKKEWIYKLAKLCEDNGIPIFMKESLRDLMGDDFRQEFPWDDGK